MLGPLQVTVRDGDEEIEVPHWFEKPEVDWEAYESFPVFLTRVWEHLGLPSPTRAQLEIAHRLQFGYDSREAKILDAATIKRLLDEPREDIIRAFRGLGKSYVTAAFVIWCVARNPRDEKILVVSATSGKAKEFVAQVKGIMASLPMVRWLLQGDRETGAVRRDEAEQFDVSGASLSQSYSIAARGITGQITGSRATKLIADDIEIEKNSITEDARARIVNIIRSDFVPITKTEHGKGDIIFLGTPQTEESVYNVLVVEMGFRCMCIPVRFPSPDKLKNYTMMTTGRVPIDILAPYLRGLFDDGELSYGTPTDTRFDQDELIKIEAKGLSAFALQYMLDTSLSDAERYPLKLHDLIVMATNPTLAPRVVQWGPHNDRRNIIKDIPNMGFSGDYLMRPLFLSEEWAKYDGIMIYVDPSGRGKDETAWAVLAQMNGIIYVLWIDGVVGDPAEAQRLIALDAKKWGAKEVVVEPNYGQGIWVLAFQPILEKLYPGQCVVKESEWAKGQKEPRIIDTLEPALASHRIVINEAILRDDLKRDERAYSLMYQLTHITRERGALQHDDRVDSLAGGVAYFMQSLAADTRTAARAQKDAEMEQLTQAFEDSLNGERKLFSRRRASIDEVPVEVWTKKFDVPGWERRNLDLRP